MFWFYLILIAAIGALLGKSRGSLWGQWLLQAAMLLLLLPIWSDTAQPGVQYSGLIGSLCCMALLFLAPFTGVLRGSLPVWAAIGWSAAWSIGAILLSFRADPLGAQPVNRMGTVGVLLFINAVGIAVATFFVWVFRFFRRGIKPPP